MAVAAHGYSGKPLPRKLGVTDESSGVPTDMTEDRVRDHVLPLGWVDVKVSAMNATWSALKLVRRLAKSASE